MPSAPVPTIGASMPYSFPAGNVVWKPADIIALMCQPGFMSPDDWRPITGTAVFLAESGGDPLATGKVVWNPGNVAHLSIDLGIGQLNSYWNTVVGPFPDVPPITIAACFDPFKAWVQVWKIINKERVGWGYQWSKWTTFKTGAHTKHITSALQGMKAYRVAMALGPGVF